MAGQAPFGVRRLDAALSRLACAVALYAPEVGLRGFTRRAECQHRALRQAATRKAQSSLRTPHVSELMSQST